MKKKLLFSVFCIMLAALLTISISRRPAFTDPDISSDVSGSASGSSDATEPEDEITQRARAIMEGMSAEEKVWQMLMVYPEQIISSTCSGDVDEWTQALDSRPAGGLIFVSGNMPSSSELKAMLSAVKAASDICPLLALDEEGGSVARLSYTLGETTDFKPMYDYRAEGTATAYSNALTIARDIDSFGFNVDLAPIADVWTNPSNTVIGRRAYSDDAVEAAELVASAVRGFSDGGVISTLKHFPGHGDTLQDSHNGVATSDKTLEQLRECEFLPFISGIEAGAGMVMVGHITLTEIDPFMPATLSRILVTNILRGELGYDGVVITDAFAMDALSGYDNSQAALMSIVAGCDIILCPDDPQEVVDLILENISSERIDQSVLRILRLKIENGLI